MGEDRGTIVVVEDDRHIAELLELYLRRDGFRVVQDSDGERALAAVARERPQLVVVDVGLPGRLNGFDVCRRLRDAGDVPVLFLTARDDEADRVLGLELGADDYVTKPFSPREVVARVRAILRRTEGGARPPELLSTGPLTIDTAARTVTAGDGPVALTAREFDLLCHLARHPGLVLTRRQLLDAVWGPGWVGDERTVDVHVRQLRRKLGHGLALTTVWGVGYRLA